MATAFFPVVQIPIFLAVLLAIYSQTSLAMNCPKARPKSFGPHIPNQTSGSDRLSSPSLLNTTGSGGGGDPVEIAKRFAQEYFCDKQVEACGSSSNSLEIKVSSVTSTKVGGRGKKISHVYLKQYWNGLPITNANMNINVLDNGYILSWGSSLFIPSSSSSSSPSPSSSSKISAKEALSQLLAHVKITEPADSFSILQASSAAAGKHCKASLAYIQLESGQLELVWDLELRDNRKLLYCSSQVSAVTGNLVSFYDMVNF